MKCPRCNGKRCEPDNSGDLVWRACKMCHGTGIVPDNNEYWFCSLSTEEKAKTIKMVIDICISCKEHGTIRTRGCLLRQNMAKGLLFLPCMDEDGIYEWLKQPHKE